MSDIGPSLPPHLLAKRKRQREEEVKNEEAAASGAKLPSSPEDGEKRRRIAGPAMPPALLDERPNQPPNGQEDESSDDDDDDFGPAPPSATNTGAASRQDEVGPENITHETEPETVKRDEWMMMPPKQDDLAARMDPLKQRPRGFNTGKGGKGPSASGDDNSSWHETPEQKRKRLEDEMMGISKPSTKASVTTAKADRGKDAAAAAKIREHTVSRHFECCSRMNQGPNSEQEKTRGASLMEQHQNSKGNIEEDDPSKRAFDREKDMGGRTIGQIQRKEMLNKASGFSSKFSGGSYL